MGIGVAKSIDIMSTYVENSFCAGGTSVIVSYTRITGIRDSQVRDTCLRDVGAVNCLRIYSQLSQILQLKQYSFSLEVGVGAS